MNSEEIFERIKKKFPNVEKATFPEKYVVDVDLQLKVPKEQIHEVCQFLKEDANLSFDFLEYLTATDWIQDKKIEMLYHLTSFEFHHRVTLRSDLSREGEPEILSVTDLFAAADWQERETYDLMGVRFAHHHNLARILLWEGYAGWPLRKDYVHITDKYDSGNEIGTPKKIVQ